MCVCVSACTCTCMCIVLNAVHYEIWHEYNITRLINVCALCSSATFLISRAHISSSTTEVLGPPPSHPPATKGKEKAKFSWNRSCLTSKSHCLRPHQAHFLDNMIPIEITVCFLKIEMVNKNFLIEGIFYSQAYKQYFIQPPMTR